jgi:hypothetical protein
MVTYPPCLDCREPLTRAPMGPAYPPEAIWSSVYLCPFCRTHRLKGEWFSPAPELLAYIAQITKEAAS